MSDGAFHGARAREMAENGLLEAMNRLKEIDRESRITAYLHLTSSYYRTPVVAPYLVAMEVNLTNQLRKTNWLFSGNPSGGDWKTEIDFNRGPESEGGRIGLRDASRKRQPLPVSWIYCRESNGEARGRYAYWIDDESAKLPAMEAGQNSPFHSHESGAGPGDLSLHQLVGDSFRLRAFLTDRARPEFPSWGIPIYFPKATWVHATDRGASDERGIYGYRRLNLNRWIQVNSDFRSARGRQRIVENVQQMAAWMTNAIPSWGTRVYAGVVSPDDAWRYALRIAANLHDYVDEDSQPTVLRHDGNGWQDPPDWNAPAVGDGAPALPPMAFGKEIVPMVTEYAGYYQPGNAGLQIDHTFEFLNPYTRSLDWERLGPCRVLLAERNEVAAKPPAVIDPDLPGEPGSPPLLLEMPRSGTISGGSYALVTTLSLGNPLENSYRVGNPLPLRIFGTEFYPPGEYRMLGDRSSVAADAETELMVVNRYGYLDLHPRLPQQGAGVTGVVNLGRMDGTKIIPTQPFGNVPAAGPPNQRRGYPLDTGDPRSQTEIWPSYAELPGQISRIAWRRQAPNLSGSGCYVRLGGDAKNPGATSGFLPDHEGVAAAFQVPEPVRGRDLGIPMEAMAVHRDGAMQSIGELGFVFDPAVSGSGVVDGTSSRGGFRTLTVGSLEEEVANPLTQVTSENRARNLIELFSVSDTNRARINLNSVLRDPSNPALRAVLEGIWMQSRAGEWTSDPGALDPNFEGRSVAVDVDAVIQGLTESILTHGPLLTVGEWSELPVIREGKCFSERPGTLMDRGREEFFRRIVELVTVKGTRFTIHLVGQTGVERNGIFERKGSCRLKVRVAVERIYESEDGLADTTVEGLKKNNRPVRHEVRVESWEEVE